MERKKNLSFVLIFLIVFFMLNYNFIYSQNNLNKILEPDDKIHNLLKTNDNQILIVTPKNITYFNPMSGYYPATYGFENDFIGFNPYGWEIFENSPTYEIETVKEKNNHKHVVHINDSEIGGYRMRYYPDSDIEVGTIELWVLGADVSDRYLEIATLDNSSITGISLRLHSDGWYYCGEYGDQLITNTTIPEDNQWYHIKMDFRCSSAANYMNLSESSYRIHIDGKNLGELPFCEPYFDKLNSFMIATDNVSDSEWWIDAIGFSWDPNYNRGDNFNEGLLLSFDCNTTLDWVGYSLDGLANKTILGNTTINLPINGTHTIQVFGNDSIGTLYASNLRFFIVDCYPDEPPPVPIEPYKFNLNPIAFTIGLIFCIGGIILILIFIIKKKSGAPKLKKQEKFKIPFKIEDKFRECPYCHNKNHIKHNYCIHCGASIKSFKSNRE